MDKYHIDGHKLLWHLDRVGDWQNGKAIAPIYVEISPISLCNHRCIFCGIDFVRDKDLHLETGMLCKRLEEMGKAGVRSVMFAGEGEPLLHKDIAKLIKTARVSGMEVSLTTNGTCGNRATWVEILPLLTWARFSVDAGSPDVYSKVHNVPADLFKKTIDSIKAALAAKKEHGLKTTIGVQFLMIEENIRDIGNALSLFSSIGVDYLSIKPYSLHPQMLNKKDVSYTAEALKDIRTMADKVNGKNGMSVIFRDDSAEKYMEKAKGFSHCRALPFWGYISSKGDFYTCSVFIGDDRFKAGNIYEQDMKDIIFGDKRKKSIAYGAKDLIIAKECRLNCRMARANEFLEFLDAKPAHVNFV